MLVKAQPFIIAIVKMLFVKLKRLGKELQRTAAILLRLVCCFVAQTTHALD